MRSLPAYRSLVAACLAVLCLARAGQAHDIPDARVDRAIQVVLGPGRLEIDYEIGLAELTLAQDLRSLLGTIPPTVADPEALYRLYGRETGPLNARGLLASVDGEPLALEFESFDLAVEEHPRFTFHLAAPLPEEGQLAIVDTNYAASEGTSRLALRSQGTVLVEGFDGPADIEDVPIRPVWMLTDAEERGTKSVEVAFRPALPPVAGATGKAQASAPVPEAAGTDSGPMEADAQPSEDAARAAVARRSDSALATGSLARLLDRGPVAPSFGLLLIAFFLGAAHAIQPGHGKTLVAAASLGERGGLSRGALLALVTTVAHTAGVVAIAAVLWVTHSTRYEAINAGLAGVAGFVIAAIGLWRLGRHLGGHGEHGRAVAELVSGRGDGAPEEIQPEAAARIAGLGTRGLVGLGLAGGMVPCWDAVLLIVVAETLGRLALGLILLAAFSAGMALILVAVGLAAGRLGGLCARREREGRWERRLGLFSGVVLAGIGLVLLASA